jgi:hypothetical protein
MPALQDRMDMWCVSFFERKHHTNPCATAYVRAFSLDAAIIKALTSRPTIGPLEFERIDVETALWKYEEEFCTPWQKQELS